MGWLSVRLGDYRSVLMMRWNARLWVRVQGADNHQVAAPFRFRVPSRCKLRIKMAHRKISGAGVNPCEWAHNVNPFSPSTKVKIIGWFSVLEGW